MNILHVGQMLPVLLWSIVAAVVGLMILYAIQVIAALAKTNASDRTGDGLVLLMTLSIFAGILFVIILIFKSLD